MNNRFLRSFFAASLALLATSVLAVSCGGDEDGAGGPGGNGPGGCTINGNACQNGCSLDLGCVDCTSDADCGPGAPFCVLGHCEECHVSADCGTGQACFPEDHQCHPACADDGDCSEPNLSHCDTMTGACVG